MSVTNPGMDSTTVIAFYAAAIATGALAVQGAQWYGARTRLKVSANAGVAPILSGDHDGHGNETSKRGEVLFVQLTNRSPHPVKVTHVGLLKGGRKNQTGLAFSRPYPLQLKLPFEIPARDNVTLWQPRDGLAEWEVDQLRVLIQTAGGDTLRSHPFCLEKLPRLEIVP